MIWRLTTAAGLVAVAAVAAVLQAHRHTDQALGGGALVAIAAVAAVAAGVRLAGQRSTRASGLWLVAAGACVPVAALPLPQAGGALPFTLALVFGAAVPVLAGAGGVPVGWAAVPVAVVILGIGLVPAVTFDPAGTGCFECPKNLVLLHGSTGVRADVLQASLWVAAAGCALLAIGALWRWWQRPALARPTTAPIALGGAVVAGLGAVAFVHQAPEGSPVVDATTRGLWVAQCGALVAIGVGVAALAVRDRRLAGRMATVVVDTIPTSARLRTALAGMLGDPGLQLAFPEHPAPAGPGVTPVTRGADVIAELHHDPALSQTRVVAAARGAGLALEHASLQARLEAELVELRESRTRVVAVGDAARRQIERDLHDGAQQRLIALTVALEDGAVRDEVRAALRELRELARGIHPVSLTDAGLAAALTVLAEEAPVPVRIAAVPDARYPPAVEAAAYRLVADGVRAATGPVVVTVAPGPVVELAAPGLVPAALAHARDRILALDGELTVTGDHCTARIPCAS